MAEATKYAAVSEQEAKLQQLETTNSRLQQQLELLGEQQAEAR